MKDAAELQKPIPAPKLKPGDVVTVAYRNGDHAPLDFLVGVARRVRKTYIVLDLYRKNECGQHIATDSMELHVPVQRYRIPQAELRYNFSTKNNMMSEYVMGDGYDWVFSVSVPTEGERLRAAIDCAETQRERSATDEK